MKIFSMLFRTSIVAALMALTVGAVAADSLSDDQRRSVDWLEILRAQAEGDKDGAVAGDASENVGRKIKGNQIVADEHGYGLVRDGVFDEEGNYLKGEYKSLSDVEAIDEDGKKTQFDGTGNRIEASIDGDRVRFVHVGGQWKEEPKAGFGSDFVRGVADIVGGIGIGGRSILGLDDSKTTEAMYRDIEEGQNKGKISGSFWDGHLGRVIAQGATIYALLWILWMVLRGCAALVRKIAKE